MPIADARSESDKAWDKKIGATISFIRQRDWHQSQSEFARSLEVSRSFLANIESGRTPLKARLGWEFCKKFDCHPGWLCSGGNSRFANVFPDLDERSMRIFEKILSTYENDPFRKFWVIAGFIALDDEFDYGIVFDKGTNTGKNTLINDSLKSKTDGVKSEIQKLIQRVKAIAGTQGTKSDLARQLGVAPARISEWLSGKKEPGGEYTLRLLQWVEQAERQK